MKGSVAWPSLLRIDHSARKTPFNEFSLAKTSGSLPKCLAARGVFAGRFEEGRAWGMSAFDHPLYTEMAPGKRHIYLSITAMSSESKEKHWKACYRIVVMRTSMHYITKLMQHLPHLTHVIARSAPIRALSETLARSDSVTAM